jgi:DNA-binding XRE family transcriptional regulator
MRLRSPKNVTIVCFKYHKSYYNCSMERIRTYSPRTLEALNLLGRQIQAARRERRWTLEGLAQRIGITVPTMRKIELGDPTVALGVAFEAASVLGLPIFGSDPERRVLESQRLDDRLAVLPARVRQPVKSSRAPF